MQPHVAITLDGTAVARRIHERVRDRAARFRALAGRAAGLATVLVGDDPASHLYVSKKEETAAAVGIAGRSERLPGSSSHAAVRAIVEALNADDAVDGILVQLPLPSQVDESEILFGVDPAKDVDGFHPLNVGRLALGLPGLRPCTPSGIMEALRAYDVPVESRHAVVVGRSNIVGKPMAALLLAANATVTTCHSRTPDLAATCRQADILVSAVGRAGVIGADAVRPGATVVDVGTNRLEHPRDDDLARRLLGKDSKRYARYVERGQLVVGDVDGLAVRHVAGLLTPVPGGVGPLTIAMLLSNTVDAAARRTGVALDEAGVAS